MHTKPSEWQGIQHIKGAEYLQVLHNMIEHTELCEYRPVSRCPYNISFSSLECFIGALAAMAKIYLKLLRFCCLSENELGLST